MSFKKSVNLLESGSVCEVGCRISRGQLLPSLCAVKLDGSVPSGITGAYHSAGTGKYFLCTDSRVYVSDGGTGFTQSEPIAGEPFFIEDIYEGNPRAVIVNGSNAITYSGFSQRAFSYGAKLCCGVMHCGRLFGVDGDDRFKVRWSGEGGLCDWEQKINGSGSVTLDPERGTVLDIVEYGEKLIALRRSGLTVLSMFGAPENFSVGLTDTDCAEIYRGTAKVAGGRLLFYTADGLRAFDGSTVKTVEHNYSRDVSAPVCAAAFDGKYFLSCYSKSLNSDAVLCYDTAEGASRLIDCKAEGLCTADAVFAYNSLGAYRLGYGGKFLFANAFDFGDDREKTVTKIFVSGNADIEISNGRISRRFTGVSGAVRPRLRGKSFTVKVTGTTPLYGLSATAEECNAV